MPCTYSHSQIQPTHCAESISKCWCCYWSNMGGCCRLLKRWSIHCSCLVFYLCCSWWCSTEEKALFSVIIPHLSLHPHAFISLPTYFMSPTCSPSLLSLFLSHSLSFSPQIIANHHMQSISFASGGDPVSHPKSAQISLWTFSIFLPPAYPSFLSSVIVYSYDYHSLHCCLACLQSSSKPDLITSCYLSFSSVYVFNFCSFALSLSSPSLPSSYQPFYPKPALCPPIKFFFPLPSSPNCLPLSSSGYGWVRSICGQRPSQPERWAETAKWHLHSSSIGH